MRCLPALLLTSLASIGVGLDVSAAEPLTFRTRFFTVRIAPNDRIEVKLPVAAQPIEARPAAQAGPVLVAPSTGLEELPAPQPGASQSRTPRPPAPPPP